MDNLESLSVKTLESVTMPPTGRYHRHLEDPVERLCREENERERTVWFHFTNENGVSFEGNEALRRKDSYKKTLLNATQYPFFVETDGPMHGFYGLVKKDQGLERKILVSRTEVPTEAYDRLLEQTKEAGQTTFPILTYDTEVEGRLNTMLAIKDLRVNELEVALKLQLFDPNVGGKSHFYHAFRHKGARMAVDLSNPADSLTGVAAYISASGIPLKLVITNEGKEESVTAEIIFFKGIAVDGKYEDKVKTLYWEEAIEASLLLPFELENEGRMEVYSMENSDINFNLARPMKRRLSITSFLMESTRKLDESGYDWPAIELDSE